MEPSTELSKTHEQLFLKGSYQDIAEVIADASSYSEILAMMDYMRRELYVKW